MQHGRSPNRAPISHGSRQIGQVIDRKLPSTSHITSIRNHPSPSLRTPKSISSKPHYSPSTSIPKQATRLQPQQQQHQQRQQQQKQQQVLPLYQQRSPQQQQRSPQQQQRSPQQQQRSPQQQKQYSPPPPYIYSDSSPPPKKRINLLQHLNSTEKHFRNQTPNTSSKQNASNSKNSNNTNQSLNKKTSSNNNNNISVLAPNTSNSNNSNSGGCGSNYIHQKVSYLFCNEPDHEMNQLNMVCLNSACPKKGLICCMCLDEHSTHPSECLAFQKVVNQLKFPSANRKYIPPSTTTAAIDRTNNSINNSIISNNNGSDSPSREEQNAAQEHAKELSIQQMHEEYARIGTIIDEFRSFINTYLSGLTHLFRLSEQESISKIEEASECESQINLNEFFNLIELGSIIGESLNANPSNLLRDQINRFLKNVIFEDRIALKPSRSDSRDSQMHPEESENIREGIDTIHTNMSNEDDNDDDEEEANRQEIRLLSTTQSVNRLASELANSMLSQRILLQRLFAKYTSQLSGAVITPHQSPPNQSPRSPSPARTTTSAGVGQVLHLNNNINSYSSLDIELDNEQEKENENNLVRTTVVPLTTTRDIFKNPFTQQPIIASPPPSKKSKHFSQQQQQQLSQEQLKYDHVKINKSSKEVQMSKKSLLEFEQEQQKEQKSVEKKKKSQKSPIKQSISLNETQQQQQQLIKEDIESIKHNSSKKKKKPQLRLFSPERDPDANSQTGTSSTKKRFKIEKLLRKHLAKTKASTSPSTLSGLSQNKPTALFTSASSGSGSSNPIPTSGSNSNNTTNILNIAQLLNTPPISSSSSEKQLQPQQQSQPMTSHAVTTITTSTAHNRMKPESPAITQNENINEVQTKIEEITTEEKIQTAKSDEFRLSNFIGSADSKSPLSSANVILHNNTNTNSSGSSNSINQIRSISSEQQQQQPFLTFGVTNNISNFINSNKNRNSIIDSASINNNNSTSMNHSGNQNQNVNNDSSLPNNTKNKKPQNETDCERLNRLLSSPPSPIPPANFSPVSGSSSPGSEAAAIAAIVAATSSLAAANTRTPQKSIPVVDNSMLYFSPQQLQQQLKLQQQQQKESKNHSPHLQVSGSNNSGGGGGTIEIMTFQQQMNLSVDYGANIAAECNQLFDELLPKQPSRPASPNFSKAIYRTWGSSEKGKRNQSDNISSSNSNNNNNNNTNVSQQNLPNLPKSPLLSQLDKMNKQQSNKSDEVTSSHSISIPESINNSASPIDIKLEDGAKKQRKMRRTPSNPNKAGGPGTGTGPRTGQSSGAGTPVTAFQPPPTAFLAEQTTPFAESLQQPIQFLPSVVEQEQPKQTKRPQSPTQNPQQLLNEIKIEE